ncbi:XkdX family protein [Bacillus subtilis]|nr:XkdX family protein [Bacillus subtilis]
MDWFKNIKTIYGWGRQYYTNADVARFVVLNRITQEQYSNHWPSLSHNRSVCECGFRWYQLNYFLTFERALINLLYGIILSGGIS